MSESVVWSSPVCCHQRNFSQRQNLKSPITQPTGKITDTSIASYSHRLVSICNSSAYWRVRSIMSFQSDECSEENLMQRVNFFLNTSTTSSTASKGVLS